MKILVTGAKGFIGKNLIAELKNQQYNEIYECDRSTTSEQLDEYCRNCEFVFHLAGVNRPKDINEFMEGNYGFTQELLKHLSYHENCSPIMLASSIQATQENPYGNSKRAGEQLLIDYGKQHRLPVYIYRFPNVFGKWCRPNYNSAVATFCYNIARGLPITVNDPNYEMTLVYIDDVIEELILALCENPTHDVMESYYRVPVTHKVLLGEIVENLYSFKKSREERSVPDFTNPFVKKLYSTYLSYLPEDGFSYPLKMNVDNRGSFTEFIRTPDRGQVSVNISKPGITKGNHWHHTKNEKFLVVSGEGLIQFRKVGEDKVIEYYVSGEQLEVVDIPTGYTHNIINVGTTDMITVMWANEAFDPAKPDTYFMKVDSDE